MGKLIRLELFSAYRFYFRFELRRLGADSDC